MKKIFLFAVVIILSKLAFSQDTIVSKNENGSAVSTDSKSQFIPSGKKKYTYNGLLIGESKMYKIMLQENDPELNSVIKKAKLARKIKFAGFAAIPLGASAVASFVISAVLENYRGSTYGSAYGSTARIYRIEAIAGSSAAVAVGITGIAFSIRHTKLKAQAVKVYNQKF